MENMMDMMVFKHGKLVNPRTKSRFIAGKIIDLNEGVSSKPCLNTGGYELSIAVPCSKSR